MQREKMLAYSRKRENGNNMKHKQTHRDAKWILQINEHQFDPVKMLKKSMEKDATKF